MSLIMPLLSVQITIILLLEILKINNQNCCPPVAIFERKCTKARLRLAAGELTAPQKPHSWNREGRQRKERKKRIRKWKNSKEGEVEGRENCMSCAFPHFLFYNLSNGYIHDHDYKLLPFRCRVDIHRLNISSLKGWLVPGTVNFRERN